jgi:hypothetical protein
LSDGIATVAGIDLTITVERDRRQVEWPSLLEQVDFGQITQARY